MAERTIYDEKIEHIERDVTELKADVRRIDAKVDAVQASLTEHRIETKEAIGTLRIEMKDEIGSLRDEMKDEIGSLRGEMKDAIGALRGEMKDTSGTLRGEMLRGFADMHRSRASQMAWLAGTMIAAVSAAAAVAKYFAAS